MTDAPASPAAQALYCASHPTRETTLRCNRCEKPICPECAVLTQVGYRCKECVRGQQKTFETAVWSDYLIAGAVAALLTWLGGALLSRLGFFVIFLAPMAGGAIAEVVRRAVGRRRGHKLGYVALGGAILGGLPLLGGPLLLLALGLLGGHGGFALGALTGLLWPGAYLFLCASTLYYRLTGLSL
ncbi:MAG: hypothetical protein HY784_04450 [Chloroflexi bacterium]|nr:hypothetical protein [Chloroflexota bacterium]